MNIHPQDFVFFAKMLKRESGLVLEGDKTNLLEARLMPVARKHGLDGLGALASRPRRKKSAALQEETVEAMATAETSFFRDFTPFERLKDTVLPPILRARANEKRLRIWYAACASGQEPYSIAMLLQEMPELQGWRCEILATDMSHSILSRAR